jgi:hypothetical protein
MSHTKTQILTISVPNKNILYTVSCLRTKTHTLDTQIMYLTWTPSILCLASEPQSKPCSVFKRNLPMSNPFILELYNKTSKWRHRTHSLCTRPCNTHTSCEFRRPVKYRPYHWTRRRQCLNNFQTCRHLTMSSGERSHRNTPVRHQTIWVIAVRLNLYSRPFDQPFRKEITPRTKPQHAPINGIRFSLRPSWRGLLVTL